MMRMPFDGPEARDLNRRIFETIWPQGRCPPLCGAEGEPDPAPRLKTNLPTVYGSPAGREAEQRIFFGVVFPSS